MAETLPIPPFPAAEASPSLEDLERAITAFRAESDATDDRSKKALLAHHQGRLHERRGDAAAAARDELLATNLDGTFVEPLEALLGIAVRGKSRANVEKLLERLELVARSPEQKERALFQRSLHQVADGQLSQALATMQACLAEGPTSAAAWLACEMLAAAAGDIDAQRRAVIGRIAQCQDVTLSALLLERCSRLQAECGDLDGALASLEQAELAYPRLSALRAREELAWNGGRPDQAAEVAVALADRLSQCSVLSDVETCAGDFPTPFAGEAEGTRLRAALAWLEAGEPARAVEQLRLSAAAVGAGLLEPALVYALALRDEFAAVGDGKAEARRALDRALEICLGAAAGADPASRFALELMRALAADDSAETVALSPELRAHVGDSVGLLALDLRRIELSGDLAALSPFVERLAELTPAAGPDRAELLGAAALLALTAGDRLTARELVGKAEVFGLDADRGQALRLGIARSERSRAEELHALRALMATATEPGAKGQWLWQALRVAAVFAGDEGDLRALLAELPADEALTQLLRFALGSPEPDVRFAELGGATSPQLAQAQQVLDCLDPALTPSDRKERLSKLMAAAPDLMLAVAVQRAGEQLDTPVSHRVSDWRQVADCCGDPHLEEAARLNAALLSLLGGAVRSVDPREHGAVALELLRPLAARPHLASTLPWLLRATGYLSPPEVATWAPNLAITDPGFQLRAATSALGRGPSVALAALETPLSPAAELLRALLVVTTGLEPTEAALSDAASFDDQVVGALLFTAGALSGDPEQRLLGARRWVQLAPAIDSHLALCAAARMAGRYEDEARGRRGLAEELGFPELLASAQLEAPRARADESRVRPLLDLAERSEPEAQGAIAWELVEALQQSASPGLLGDALALLARALPGDADGDAAALRAGFQAIVAEQDHRALELLLPLAERIPDDPTVLWGVRVAARRTGRADLEASACAELARAVHDHREAAGLWERAGVLYQDILSEPAQAEAAFSAAMSRVPGSPLSFVRLYQLARAASDRPRMIELLDGRLESADEAPRRMELLWEKARLCRIVGRRAACARALEELLAFDSGHLPALALSAELHLVDQRHEKAADALRAVALHPDTPDERRGSVGLYAADLLERLKRPREAVALIAELEAHGVPEAVTLERRARVSAGAGDWDTAYSSFKKLAEEQDDIASRLQAARMLLAIQRDHLLTSDSLKDAARLVLRDAPTDADAVLVVIEQNFHPQERARLLKPARDECLATIRNSPLDSSAMSQLLRLSAGGGEPELERVALGSLALVERLSEEHQIRLESLQALARRSPTGSLSVPELEALAAGGQLGTFAVLAQLIMPKIAKATMPSLDALGVAASMAEEPLSGSTLQTETESWADAFGVGERQLYRGGTQTDGISVVNKDAVNIVIGQGLAAPLGPVERARLAYLLFAERLGVGPLVQLGLSEARSWLAAVARLSGQEFPSVDPEDVEEKSRELARLFGEEERALLGTLLADLSRSGAQLVDLALISLSSAVRAAVLAHGEQSIIRQLPELLPPMEIERAQLLASVLQLVASPSYLECRRRLGLDLI